MLRVAPGSTLSTASYRQTDSGSLEIGLRGVVGGVSNGRLMVSASPLELAGTLALETCPTVPLDADWESVLVAAAVERIGEFTTIEGLDALPGAEVRYPEEGVVLVNRP